MPRPKLRTEAQQAAVLAEIARRYRAGETQATIAAAVGLSRQAITYYLPRLHAAWRTDAAADIAARMETELARIDTLEATAWAEYERSQADAQRTQVRTGAEGAQETTRTTEGRLGDPRYLERVSWCIEQRCKLFGLYAQSDTLTTVLIKAYAGVDWEQV